MEKDDGNEQVDCLSKMPDDIISFIIAPFCIRDVAKFRTLSKRWKHVCPSKSDLEFDIEKVLGYTQDLSCKSSDFLREIRCKFVQGVDQCLKLYEGQKLDSLRIFFPLGDEDATHIDSWIRHAISAGSQKLDLDFTYRAQWDDLYDFPFSNLYEGKQFQLKHLQLKFCKLKLSPHLGSMLKSLNTLNLEQLFLDKTSVDVIISNALNLEWLRFKSCLLPGTLNIQGQHLRLKSLILHDCSEIDKIDIHSTSLTSFEFLSMTVMKLCFHDVPCLEKVHIWFCLPYAQMEATDYIFNRLPDDLPHLEYLSLVLPTDERWSVPRSMNRFKHLKRLDLFVMHAPYFDLVSLTPILNASPLLQKFYLSLKQWSNTDRRGEQQYSNCVHYQLKEVEVHGFTGSSNEMKLVIYLLENAISLKQLTLSPHAAMYHGGGRWVKRNGNLRDKQRQEIHDLLLKQRQRSRANLVLL